MREQILNIINNTDKPVRARDIAGEIGKWVCEVAIECSVMADEGLIEQTTYRDVANMEFYCLYGKRED